MPRNGLCRRIKAEGGEGIPTGEHPEKAVFLAADGTVIARTIGVGMSGNKPWVIVHDIRNEKFLTLNRERAKNLIAFLREVYGEEIG